jgi:long-chain fatty acid transport protein
MKLKKSLVLAAAVAAAVAAPGAFATNGYLSHGIGMDAKGMGGVGIAIPQGGMAAASNPANQMYVGNRLTFGMDWFRPFRSATGTTAATDTAYRDSGSTNYYVPELGYARPIGSSSSLGVVVYGAGLGTDYGVNGRFGTTTSIFSLMQQMTIAPTWATKMGNHSFGASLNLVRQTLDIRGMQNFATYSRDSANLTDKGEDIATGYGVKLGWTGELTPNFTMGATIQPQTSMSKYGRYKGLLAEQGKLDVPAQYGLGLAWKAGSATNVGFDVVKVKWNSVKSLGNRFASLPSCAGGSASNPCLGDNDGIGFGWQDQTIYKLGVSHQIGKWTLRAGYNYGKTPLVADQTLFNIIMPAVTETHYTLGASWAVSSSTDVSLSYMYAPTKELKGLGNAQDGVSGANPNLKMNQNSLGIGFNIKM